MLRHVNILDTTKTNVEYKEIKKGNQIIKCYDTPVGSVESVYENAGNTMFKKSPFIKTREDIKIMQYITEHTQVDVYYKQFIETDTLIGEHGIATVSSPLTPIQQLLQHTMGVAEFTYALFDYPNEMEEYMNAIHELNLRTYRLYTQTPEIVKVFISYEDTSTTVMSKTWYNNYSKPQIDEYSDIMHDGGKIHITHMCGKLKGFVNEIASGKMDGIDSVCPPTTGDLHAYEALENMPNKIIIGGLEPPALTRMTVTQTKEYVRNILNKCNSYNNFILSTGDATSYGTPIENLIAITEVVNEYK